MLAYMYGTLESCSGTGRGTLLYHSLALLDHVRLIFIPILLPRLSLSLSLPPYPPLALFFFRFFVSTILSLLYRSLALLDSRLPLEYTPRAQTSPRAPSRMQSARASW